MKKLEEKIDEYADESVGSKDPNILAQHYAKAGLGIAELQRRYAVWSLCVSIVALLVSLMSILVVVLW